MSLRQQHFLQELLRFEETSSEKEFQKVVDNEKGIWYYREVASGDKILIALPN